MIIWKLKQYTKMPPRLRSVASSGGSNGMINGIRICYTPLTVNAVISPRRSNLPCPHPFPRFFSSTPSSQLMRVRRRSHDPYVIAQARQHKAANIARREQLSQERASTLGDPVRGITTPFLQALDLDVPPPVEDVLSSQFKQSIQPRQKNASRKESEPYLNHFLTSRELRAAVQYSSDLTTPIPSQDDYGIDAAMEEQKKREHKANHDNARLALSRIASLANASSRDRTRTNIQRCIQAFGRHETEKYLAPRAASRVPRSPDKPPVPTKTPRVGPDTGSSEVQIAILTTKIRKLANHLESGNKKDKANKRNLTLLVHKRQKLLKYLRRKERGGERWENLVSTLGLTDGTWKEEISL
jgi:ribosomal protein S15